MVQSGQTQTKTTRVNLEFWPLLESKAEVVVIEVSGREEEPEKFRSALDVRVNMQ